jgi:hypothetical protein
VRAQDQPRGCGEEHDAALARTRAAIARDVTTLASLGVPQLPPERVRDEALWAEELLEPEDFARLERLAVATDVRRLAAIESGLAHGALEGNAVATADGAILLGWSRAHLGCPLIDDPAGDDDARRLAALFAVRWLVWEAREMLRARRLAADLVRAVLVQYT